MFYVTLLWLHASVALNDLVCASCLHFPLLRWRWLVYINPNYYAVSSVAVFVLSDFQAPCPGSEFGCFLQSGTQILQQFNFDQVNPYIHLTVSYTCFV